MTKKDKTKYEMTLMSAHHDFEKDLKRYSFYKIHDRTMSEDLVQDTFMKTWKYLVRGGKIEMMRAFLYNILNNLIIDQYRKNKNQYDSLDNLMEAGFEPGFQDTNTLINVLDGKRASLLIPNLPAMYRNLMYMKYMENLSLSEMSAITKESKNTVAVKLHRGLSKLKSIYFSSSAATAYGMT